MRIRFPRPLFIALILLPAPLFAAHENNIEGNVSFEQRRDIDFETTTWALGAKAITGYGMFLCNYGKDSGETRIDTFDNIFGTSAVRNFTWNAYNATRLKCGYGLKLPLYGGELRAGFGGTRYLGETDVSADGKEIDLYGTRLDVSYRRGDYHTQLQLKNKHYDYLYHYQTLSYDSDTQGTIRQLDLNGEWGSLHSELQRLDGHKEKTFSDPPLPLPNADFHYSQTTLSLGPQLKGNVLGIRYVAPTYVSGSERGSFNELDLQNGFRGAIIGGQFGETRIRLRYLDLTSSGSRDYSPVTTDMAEKRDSSLLAMSLQNDTWDLTLQNRRSVHHGYITVTSSPIPYTLMVNCASASCSYDNTREENEWTLKWRYHLTQRIVLGGKFYRRDRKDKQYEEPLNHYIESGGALGMSLAL